MIGPKIAALRERLGFSQVQLAQLMGVHPLTVSRWERGQLTPTPHQAALLGSFDSAAANQEKIGDQAGALLLSAGVAVALYALLDAAFGRAAKGRS